MNLNEEYYCQDCGTPLLYLQNPCPKCGSTLHCKSLSHVDNVKVEQPEKNFFNFDFMQPYNDLMSDKKNIMDLFAIVLMFLILDIFQEMFKIKSASNIIDVILSSYLCIMANNIIQSKTPVLSGFGNNKTLSKSIFWTGFKQNMAQLIYVIVLAIAGYFLASFLSNNYGIKLVESWIIASILLVPFIIFSLISSFVLFCENLSFSESFNIFKSINSFKYSWKGYLSSSVLFTVLLITAIVIVTILTVIFKNSIIKYILTPLLYTFVVFLCYFVCHYLAQSYKYALCKMKAEKQ